MRLKVLIVPFFIIIILVLGIGYIKPDFDVMQMKQAEIVRSEAERANTETVLANISSLNNSLDTEQEAERFMYRYLPETLNQEQVIDAFNFLANQSGLVIASMELEKPIDIVPPEEPLIDPSANALIAGGSLLGNSDAPAPVPPVIAKTFILTGSVTGSYENIKLFFNQVSHIERFQKIHLFSIAVDTKTESPDGAENPNGLVGTFEAEFGYLPPKPVASALGMPIFLQSKFDFSNVDRLLTQITNPLPPLEKGETGKPNPFQ